MLWRKTSHGRKPSLMNSQAALTANSHMPPSRKTSRRQKAVGVVHVIKLAGVNPVKTRLVKTRPEKARFVKARPAKARCMKIGHMKVGPAKIGHTKIGVRPGQHMTARAPTAMY
jgi:hypothetical protein